MSPISEREWKRRLAEFGELVFLTHRDDLGDLDGDFLQETAINCGLVEEVTVTEACGEVCNCAEYGPFPQQCLRPVQVQRKAVKR